MPAARGIAMTPGVLSMGEAERERAHLIRQTRSGHLSQREAAERLGIGVRQFKRLVQTWKQDGDAGLISRQRGCPSNRRLPADRLVACVLQNDGFDHAH